MTTTDTAQLPARSQVSLRPRPRPSTVLLMIAWISLLVTYTLIKPS